MDTPPIVELVIHIAALIAFVWFVFYWSALFSKQIEPALRQLVIQRTGVEIVRRQKGPSYHWATPDTRSKSKTLVFVWCALLFLTIGSGPMIIALFVVGLFVNTVNG